MSDNKSRESTFKSDQIEVGYHPAGFRIDKTATPMNRYTKWVIISNGEWGNPQAVCFHSLPEDGWIKSESFDWSRESAEIQK